MAAELFLAAAVACLATALMHSLLGEAWLIGPLVRSRSGHIDRLRRMHLPSPGKAQDIVRHHKLITKAIASGEPDEAQKHLRTHLSGTLSELARIRTQHPQYLND